MGATDRVEQRPDEPKPKRKLRNLLIDKRFQLRWVLKVVIAVSIIVTVIGYFLYSTVVDATDQILAQKLGDPALTEKAFNAFIEHAEHDKRVTLGTLVAGLVSLVILLGLLTIISTHKIAGPIFKMKKIFKSIDGDNLQLWAKLRKDDELQDVFTEFEHMLRRIREHRRKDTEGLEKIRNLAEDRENTQVLKETGELIERYKDSVKMD